MASPASPGGQPDVRVGLSAYDVEAAEIVALAAAADRCGFDSLWLGEHLLLPVGYGSEHPTSNGESTQHHTGPIVAPDSKLVDPLITLAACAAVTERILLCTGMYLLALRPPLVSARMAHTLQGLSGGRFRLGVGMGWLAEEFDALGVAFAERRRRLEESIEICRLAWAGGPFGFTGRHFALRQVQLTDEPAHIPIILGGNSDQALTRAAALGDGWFSSGTPSLDEACTLRDRIGVLVEKAGRQTPFPLYVRIPDARPETVARYRGEGFDRLVVWADQVWPERGTLDEKRAAMALQAARLGLRRNEPSALDLVPHEE